MLSMPFGRLFMDYDERAIAIAKTLSINVVLSAYGGGNAEGQPLYNIRRISVHEGKLEDGIDTFINTLRDPVIPVEFIEKEKRIVQMLIQQKHGVAAVSQCLNFLFCTQSLDKNLIF